MVTKFTLIGKTSGQFIVSSVYISRVIAIITELLNKIFYKFNITSEFVMKSTHLFILKIISWIQNNNCLE